MSRFSIVLGLLVVAGLAASPAVADIAYSNTTGKIKLSNGVGSPGGEFGVEVIGGLFSLPSADRSDGFVTFCVEGNEYLYSFNVVYDVVLNTAVDGGGIGGPVPDPIGADTAALYKEFRTATSDLHTSTGLGGTDGYSKYSYNQNSDHYSSANDFQMAIWYLEEEKTWSQLQNDRQKAWAKWAEANPLTGTLPVAVMNLYENYNEDPEPRQDQLTLVIIGDSAESFVPTPSAAMAGVGMLLGLGLVGLRRRKIRKG